MNIFLFFTLKLVVIKLKISCKIEIVKYKFNLNKCIKVLPVALLMAFFSIKNADSMQVIYRLPVSDRNLIFYHWREGNFNQVEDILKEKYYTTLKNIYLDALADFYIEMQDYNKAQDVINRLSTSKNAKDPYLQYVKTELMYQLMDDSKSAEYSKILKARQIKNSDAFIAVGNKALNNAAKEKDPVKKLMWLDEAQKDFYYAQKYNNSSAEAHVGMAKVYFSKGRKPAAYDEILIAEEMGVYTPETQYYIGSFFYSIGDYNKAMFALKKPLVYKYKKGAKVHLLLGKIYEELGDPLNAQKEYKMAVKLSPKNAEAKTALNNLNAIINIKYDSEVKQQKVKSLSIENMLDKADTFLVIEKLANARDLYLQVLEQEPDNSRAIASLMELYYTQWAIGYFNQKNFFMDNLYFYQHKLDTPAGKVAQIKLNIISSPRMSNSIKNDLESLSNSQSQAFADMLNSLRASFLLNDYSSVKKKLFQMGNMPLTDDQKVIIVKALYLDRDFYDAKNVLSGVSSYGGMSNSVNLFNSAIDARKAKIKEIQADVVTLNKEKKYDQAILNAQNGLIFFPTYSSLYVDIATSYKKLKLYDKAKIALDQYDNLQQFYPDEDVDKLYKKQARKLQKNVDRSIKKRNIALNNQ